VRTRRPCIALALTLGISFAALGQVPPPALSNERAVPFEVTINGAKSGTWVFVERGGVLYAPREAFEEWRLELPPGTPTIQFRDQPYRQLSSVPGFRAKVDYANQSIELLFSPQSFSTMKLTREITKRAPPSEVLPSIFLNYDLSFQGTRPRDAASVKDLGMLNELGLSGSLGVLTSSSALRNLVNDPTLGSPRQFLRLETTFTHDFPDSNRTLRIGDSVTRGAMGGRDVYFGGVRYGTNFALTPGLVTQPLPVIGGISAAPSTVELYVNNVLRQVSNVPTGPFVIDNSPILTGTGEARLVVRDLLGRETVVTQPFFTSSQLLAAGLDDWSVEAGRVRHDIGIASDNYGDPFASGTWRRGMSNTLTLEGRLEASRGLRVVDAGMLSLLPWNVLAKAALAGSQHDRLGDGGRWLVGLEHQSLRAGATIEFSGASARFREVGLEDPLLAIKYQAAANFLYNADRWGTLGLGYADIRRFDGTHVTTISGNYSVRVGARGSLVLSASRAMSGGSGSSIGATLLLPLDSARVVNITAGTHGDTRDLYAAAVQNPGIDSDLGWRVLAGEQQSVRRAEGGLYYQGRYGAISADASKSSSQQSARIGATGGFVLADDHLFLSRRVDESFALVEVPGYGGVGIGLGSNVLTRTNEDGVALVPRLVPYVVNSIRLDPKELPINAELDSIERQAVPAWRSAVKVQFPVRAGRGALIRIVLDDGDPAPAGAVVTLEGDAETFYVARRGEAYVTGILPASKLRLAWNGAQCPISITLPPDNPDQIPRVGPVTCKGVPR
jgi:outer membrane usher protein